MQAVARRQGVERHDVKRGIVYCVILVCGALAATAQTNQPSRPPQPVELVMRIGECESRVGTVEVVVSAKAEPAKSTLQIQCRLNGVETTCEMDPTNAVVVAQLVQGVTSDMMNGKQSAHQHKNIEVDWFQLEDRKLVEIVFHQGDSTEGESTCRLWLDSYNALSLSRLILSGKAAADWLEPKLVPLE
jgi:hypothetical protein